MLSFSLRINLLNFVNGIGIFINILSLLIELYEIKCKLAYNQIKIIMKKLNFQKKRLSKKELKEIKGARPVCPRVISCIDPDSGVELYGVTGVQDGYCC
ncbi:hypothetical protein [Chryseobacterium shigense]|uniref:Bacteriocin-type signal sequence-containing protein n=1 Tax=Chryseobacterium shigense TaxID=297244 RepID=A0A841N4H6_9FLAO|nr:hypothetical protein [Chryseobacterium shigense]MBB6371377.1 hypothetical protein [Chryseobacterium shigense]